MSDPTQTLTSYWGREPLTVGAAIPTVALRHKLGRVHVGTSDADVREIVLAAITQAPVAFTEIQVRETIAAALWLHAENRAEYAHVMGGRL